ATVGQVVTYTVAITNPSKTAATGVVLHVAVPGTIAITSLGGGVRAPLGVDFAIGTLAAGATRLFAIKGRPVTTGTVTLTTSATAERTVLVGRPASVTTTVVGLPPSNQPAPRVMKAVRFGFHNQPTILVVTFSEKMNPARATDPRNYAVLIPGTGGDRPV